MILSIFIHLLLLSLVGVCIYMFIVYRDTRKIYKQIPINSTTMPAIKPYSVIVPPVPSPIKPVDSK